MAVSRGGHLGSGFVQGFGNTLLQGMLGLAAGGNGGDESLTFEEQMELRRKLRIREMLLGRQAQTFQQPFSLTGNSLRLRMLGLG